MRRTQWRPPPVSLLRDPSDLLRLYGDPASEPPVTARTVSLGLPTPIWPSKEQPTPSQVSQQAATRQGMYVHATIGMIANDAQGASLDTLDRLVSDALRVVVVGRENGNLPRARARMSGLVHQYARVFLPPPGTEFHGTEVPVPGGRADLLWWHPVHGWFFDEVKTFRFAGEDDLDYRAQVTKYLTAGENLDGNFAGVWLISLGNTLASRLYTPDGLVIPLLDSPLAPQQLRTPTHREDDA